jgi:uncharacterized membrane protein/protein-disulfide isomerase
MTSRQRALVLLFAIVGLGATAASTYVHYQLLRNPGYTSFCDISATVNCESVYQSAYGSVRGIPVALAGLLWFALVVLLAWFDTPRVEAAPTGRGRAPAPAPPASETSSYLFLLSTAALAVVLYMAYASFFVLKTLCVLCALTYVAVIGVFLVSGAASQSAMSAIPARLAGDLRRLLKSPVALTIACLYLLGAASAVAFFPRSESTPVAAAAAADAPAAAPANAAQEAQIVEFQKWLSAQPRVPVMVPDDGAAVVIVKFNDYQCPPCRQTYMEYKPIVERYQAQYPGKVKFVTKDFPLEAECNTGGVHAAGCEAAAGVRMARMKNKADAFEAWLFANQGTLSPDQVREGVKSVGGVTDFDAQYPKVLEQVRADVAQGRQLGVNRTPTFFINGVKIEGGLRPQFFDAAIAHELKSKGAASRQ